LHKAVSFLGAGFTMRAFRALVEWRNADGARAALKRSNLLVALRLVARDDDERASVDAFERITSQRATARKVAERWPRWVEVIARQLGVEDAAEALTLFEAEAVRLNPGIDRVALLDALVLGGPNGDLRGIKADGTGEPYIVPPWPGSPEWETWLSGERQW